MIKREYLKFERALRHEPIDEDLWESQLIAKTDDALRVDLAAALEILPAHCLEVALSRAAGTGPVNWCANI